MKIILASDLQYCTLLYKCERTCVINSFVSCLQQHTNLRIHVRRLFRMNSEEAGIEFT